MAPLVRGILLYVVLMVGAALSGCVLNDPADGGDDLDDEADADSDPGAGASDGDADGGLGGSDDEDGGGGAQPPARRDGATTLPQRSGAPSPSFASA